MAQYILIGITAGVVSALLFVSAATGSALAVFLFYAAPLPLYVAGFGWGTVTALCAMTGGAAAAFLIGGSWPGALYLASVAAPAFWLTRLAVLSRPVDADDPAGPREFYPLGRLVLWTVGLGAGLVSATLLFLGFDADGIHAQLEGVLGAMIDAGGGGLLPEGADRQDLVRVMARIVPPASAALWTLTTLINMWLAARIVAVSGRSPRPWPDIPTMDFPRAGGWAFMAAIALSFAPGLVGLVASIFASTLSLAFVLLGLAILHVLTRGMSARPFILGALYFALIVLSWTGIIIAAIGLGEPLFRWRERALARQQGGPRPPRPPLT